jgi:hypothetical protein
MDEIKKKSPTTQQRKFDPLFGWEIQSQDSWYWSDLLIEENINGSISTNPALSDVYQFGVCTGNGLCHIARMLKEEKASVRTYHGFDVFSGMPEEENEPIFDVNWTGGVFNELERRGASSVTEVVQALLDEWDEEHADCSLCIYAGLYKDSLPELKHNRIDFCKENLRPALVVHIDCDLYTSTIEALDFMYSMHLIQPGTIIIYDDWGGTKNWQQAHSGESRAHKEMTLKYKVSYLGCIQFGVSHPDNNCPENIQRGYVVQSIGDEPTLDSEIIGTIVGSCKNTLVDVDSDVPSTPQPWPKGY